MWVKHELNYLSSDWALYFLLEEGSINEQQHVEIPVNKVALQSKNQEGPNSH